MSLSGWNASSRIDSPGSEARAIAKTDVSAIGAADLLTAKGATGRGACRQAPRRSLRGPCFSAEREPALAGFELTPTGPLDDEGQL